jgi:hypothetical protein
MEFIQIWNLKSGYELGYLNSFFQYFPDDISIPLIIFFIHLIMGPLVSYLILRGVAYFRPNRYNPNLEQVSYWFIISQLIVIPFYFVYSTQIWELAVFYFLYLLLGAFFIIKSVIQMSRFSFYAGMFCLFLTLGVINQLSPFCETIVFLLLLIPIVLILLIPNFWVRLKTHKQSRLMDYDLIPPNGYLYWRDWFVQSLLMLLWLVYSHMKMINDDFYFLYVVIAFFIGCSLLYFNHYKSSHLSKYLSWIFIFSILIGLVIKVEIYKYGISWFILFIIAGSLAAIWKVHFATSFIRQIKGNFDELSRK